MVSEFVTSAAANTVRSLATEYASPYVSYFFRYGKIIEDFRRLRNQLECKKDRVKNDVEKAKRQTEVIEKDVQEWLTRAEKELGEARSLADEIERSKCFSWCPSWGWRYCLCKKIAKKTLDISKLLDTGDFSRVGHRAPLEGIELILLKDVTPSRSSKIALNGIMKALENDAVSMIGLYGMPGVGKTTLAKEVGKQARQKQLFDKVVMVTVSQTPDINKIQDKIAEILGLEFGAKTEGGRAEELWRRLRDEKKMLIILDDVWEEIKLETFGMILNGEHKGFKFLLTTRLHQVCIKMDCQKIFRLDILCEDEAWALFKDTAGLQDVSSTLADVAKEVARECKGLPLALVTIGKALKGESLDGWIVANQQLKDSRHADNQDVCEGIYNCLKLSYDYLKEEKIRSCFLLCSLFPEDDDISIEMLTVCAIGQGLFSNIYSFEDIRREIRVALTRLQKSGLLLEADDEYVIRMHDVIRDFAHWITSKGENKFMVKDGLTEWPMSESFGCFTAVSLWNCKISYLPDKFESPKLKTLFLMSANFLFMRRNSLKVSAMFFEGTKALRALFLREVVLSLDALRFLADLRTLWFEGCELKNISSLGNMKSLEILALCDTNICELPEQLVELPRLKSLYFFGQYFLGHYFPTNLLSRLASLQELYVGYENNNVNISELNSLSRLTALTISIDEYHFQENSMFPKLQRYNIAVNRSCDYLTTGRTLKIFDFSSSLTAFKELFCNVENLTLWKIMEHKNIVPNVDLGGLNELTSLQLRECKDLECLIDATGEQGPTTAFSNLVELKMKRLSCFKELCHGQPPITFLEKLKDVSIVDCQQLQVVFHMDGFSENLTSLYLISLPELERIWKPQTYHSSLQSQSPQSLKVVSVWYCKKLKYIFSHCILPSLEELEISNCEGLEQVFGFIEESDGKDITLPQLRYLLLEDLISLRSFCSRNCSVKLPSLKQLHVRNCPHLTHFMPEPDVITAVEAEVEENQASISPSNSTCLEMESLPQLSCLWKVVNLQSLKTMEIWWCHKLEYLFSPTLAQTLVHLEELQIGECESLEHLIAEAKNEDEIVSNMSHRYALCWPKLKVLKINYCGSLKYVFPIALAQGLPCLESVEIIDCPQLMQVFTMAKEEDGQHIVLQSLQFLTLGNLESLCRFCPENFVISLSLKEFKVYNCPMLTRLENHQGLAFRVLLKHIIEELESGSARESDSAHLHAPLLPRLTTLGVSHCPRLEYVFQVPLAQGLPTLKSVMITDSPQLKQVFGYQGELDIDDDQKVIEFPELSEFSLIRLPLLERLAPMGYHFRFPCLDYFEVTRCPKLTTNFSMNSEGVVHAIAEAPQQVQNNTIECFTTMEKIVDDDRPTSNGIFWSHRGTREEETEDSE